MTVDVIGLLSIQLFVLQFMMIDVVGLLGIYIVTPMAFHEVWCGRPVKKYIVIHSEFHEGWCGRPVKYIVIHSEFRGR